MFRARTPPEAIDLVSRLLQYTPTMRTTPLEACAHSFFNELRLPQARLPSGRELPPLFNFTDAGGTPPPLARAAPREGQGRCGRRLPAEIG